MESGVGVDIVSLRPKVLTDQRDDRERRKAQTEAELRAKAEDLALGFSEQGARFCELVEGRLIKRTVKLIESDPEASAYEKILADMGHRFNAAKQAVDRLHRIHMGAAAS